ncbi:TrwC relaxase [Leifsonia sp. 98AMF]|nr:TrwC relaxase [Leifsonia sp. 197AMF]SDI77037.1 TrwC relaxase [Leifsonia sp. 466MF]SDK09984.1 TrwC relaxase [Leifsonia sp. 157MF]SDN80407.1 TrwC relaxase [Leifsonia sp. 509MF]SEN27053.1 TrwC relaxase [Leifsonia sp. 467MF]SFL81487.1 TrwC relaxase [Leifsonia sp. 98AMF]
MRGGAARWKRGQQSHGVKQAVNYAFSGSCDATLTAKTPDGVIAAAGYADAVMTRYIVENGAIRDDLLSRDRLKAWVDGLDPLTGERRGRDLESPVADLILDATINAPKSFSIAAMLDPDLAAAYEDLQDRLRDRIIKLWQSELNARRGKGGAIRENLVRIEVVELRHERSRSLDPHKHRHLWLNVKVQGEDGKWSNIDTRVALRFQNVINAEGDLASRTDPAWIGALTAKGFTLNEDGEIAQLQHLVRPLSKRSAQIEANRIARIAWWRQQHPGEEPSHDVFSQIDHWAWAVGRPNKPGDLDEDGWATLVREELFAADPTLGVRRSPARLSSVAVQDLDLELLAAKAVVDADARSTGSGGRFSLMDVRAGALRAIAATGVVADREELAKLADELVAHSNTVTLISELDAPKHVKHLMATSTATLKATLAHHVDALSAPGKMLGKDEVVAISNALDPSRTLDNEQLLGAAALGGTSRNVVVSGPAGTGKTTMLKVAGAALQRRGHKMIIVAPTKKASSVAGRETMSASSSLHQFLHEFGWRWAADASGATVWSRLSIGEIDPISGGIYRGPRISISPGDRIVVDEAGMLDLEAGSALVDVIARTGAGVALIGDELQALPVGHSGAMALFWRRSADRVQLRTTHRFKDPAWADLTLRVRDPQDQQAMQDVADALIRTDHVVMTDNDVSARDAMVNGWFEAMQRRETISLVTATHAEAQEISEAIQARRIEAGSISTTRTLYGQAGQAIFAGDVVQTRRNDSTADVENRQNWIVKTIGKDHVILAASTDSTDLRKVSLAYAEAHIHLAYATTVYGVQGETTDRSLVGPGVDAAGLYVGLTRGKVNNVAVLVAPTQNSARTQLVESMQRRTVEETMEKSRAAARSELRRAAQSASGPIAGAPAPQNASVGLN